MEVIQIPKIDQFKPVPTIRVRTYFILRHRLNESTLRDALDSLIRNHWRKLGARIATRREDGLLEYHLPHKFEDNFALFKWTSQQHTEEMASLGLPKPTPAEYGVTFHPHIEDLELKLSPPDWQFDTRKPYVGEPLLSIHLSQFADGSYLAVNYPHPMGDQFGLSNIMKAWLGLTRGVDPPPMIGIRDDPLPETKEYAEYQRVDRKGRTRVRRKGEYALALLPIVPELILHNKEIRHTIFIPLTLVQSLVERSTTVLRKKYGPDVEISQNDVLVALSLKFGRIHHRKPQMMSLTQTMNLRGRTPNLQGINRDGFIHNCANYSTTRFRLDPSIPLSEIAYQNRQALAYSAEPKTVEVSLAMVREMVRRGQPNLTCEPFERFHHVTSWSAAWKGLDFLSVSESSKKDPNTSELLVLGSGLPRGLPNRFVTIIVCKTAEGYFLNYAASAKSFKLLKEHLERDPNLEDF